MYYFYLGFRRLKLFRSYYNGHWFSDALVYAFFGVFGLEFFSLARIKKAEIDKAAAEKIEEDINIDDLEKEINEAIEAGK